MLSLMGLAALAVGQERGEPLDLGTWKRMPTFQDGRMMPVNTFARRLVQTVCHRVNPRLSLAGAAHGVSQSPGLIQAGKLFPAGKPRRFTAAELLLSWLVEPQRWEHVPFLICEHERLRRDVLGLPVFDATGRRLRYVSPAQVAASLGFRQAAKQLVEKQRQGSGMGQAPQLDEREEKVDQLLDAYLAYRSVTFDPRRAGAELRDDPVPAGSDARRFLHRLTGMLEASDRLARQLGQWTQLGIEDDTVRLLGQIQHHLEQLRQLAMHGDYGLDRAEPMVVALRDSTGALARQMARYRDRLMERIPEHLDRTAVERFCTMMYKLALVARDFDRQAHQLHLSLYDNGGCLRLVPALDPAALERNRDDGEDAQPWLAFQTLTAGSKDVLAGYPWDQVVRVREAFAEVARVYQGRQAADRAMRFAAAMGTFAAEVRRLGESLEPVRRKLPVAERDEELFRATAYPPPGATEVEVHYYDLDPFFWSWLVSLGAMASLSLCFGPIRKPMFWLGIGVLLVAQLFTAYGLGLRVYITGWAPVTNMFETVIFVALVVALLGVWFTLVPLVWPGLRTAWRLTAVPATPEQRPCDEAEGAAWDIRPRPAARAGLLLARLAVLAALFYVLTMVPYGSGQQPIIRLVPRRAVGSSLPSLGSIGVWAVGMSVLVVTLWLVPRIALAGLMGLVTVPYALVKGGLQRPIQQALARRVFAWVGAAVACLAALVAYYSPVLNRDIGLLMPVLRDNFWLTVHVLTITASYGAGALAWGLGLIALVLYLLGRYHVPQRPSPAQVAAGHRPRGDFGQVPVRRHPPQVCHALGAYIYKAIQVAVLLLAAGTILGGLWADVSWGRFWGWDPKEVWALVSLLAYLVVLHGRYAGWFGNFGLAVGSVLGATAIMMAWYGLNAIIKSGLHAYGNFEGGLPWILAIGAANWALVLAAAVRYRLATAGPLPASEAHSQPRARREVELEQPTGG